MGEQWTAMHLMEVVLLGELGPDAYNALWDGTGDWGSAEVTAALETYAEVLKHVNSDAAGLTWQDASQLVANGDAAFNVMGDWCDGYFSGTAEGGNLGLVPGEGYGWAPPPGTDGTFQFLSDSFTLAKGAPHAEGALAWLKTAGSKAGQEAFNPVKGSICARTDCDHHALQCVSADGDGRLGLRPGGRQPDPRRDRQRHLEERDQHRPRSVPDRWRYGRLPVGAGDRRHDLPQQVGVRQA